MNTSVVKIHVMFWHSQVSDIACVKDPLPVRKAEKPTLIAVDSVEASLKLRWDFIQHAHIEQAFLF